MERGGGRGRGVALVLLAGAVASSAWWAARDASRTTGASAGLDPGGSALAVRAQDADEVAPGRAAGLELAVLELPAFDLHAFDLHVVSRAGAPVERYALATIAARGAEVLAFEHEAERPGGRARVAVPARDFHVEVRASGWRPARVGPLAAAAPPERVELALEPAGGVRGHVLALEQPVAGARVGLYAVAETRETFNGFPLRTRVDPELEAESDAEGRFALSVARAGRYVLRVDAPGFAPAESAPITLAPEDEREERVELGPGGTLSIQLRARGPESVAGRLVALSRGDGRARTLRTDAEGRAQLAGLTPGAWQVELSEVEIDPERGALVSSAAPAEEVPSSCEIRAGETTALELWLAE